MRVRQRVFWPHYKTDVERWCLECKVCAQIEPDPDYKLHQKAFQNRIDHYVLDRRDDYDSKYETFPYDPGSQIGSENVHEMSAVNFWL